MGPSAAPTPVEGQEGEVTGGWAGAVGAGPGEATPPAGVKC